MPVSDSSPLVQVGVVSIPVLAVCLILQLCIIVHMIQNTKSKLPNTSIALSYAACISYSLYSFNTLIQSVYAISVPSANFDASICTYRYLTPPFFLIAKICMTVFYITRLFNLFCHTSMGTSKWKLQLFALYVIIGFTMAGIWFVILAIVGFWTADPEKLAAIQSFAECWEMISALSFASTFVALAVGINSIVDLSSSVIILRLYLKKLAVLSATYDTAEFRSVNHRAKNTKFLNIMLKTTNLVILSICTEFMVFVVNGMGFGEFWLAINHTINVLCIYLSYGGFNDKIYNKLCCCTHKYCNTCCTRICFCCCLPKNKHDDDSILIDEETQEGSKTDPVATESKTRNSGKMNRMQLTLARITSHSGTPSPSPPVSPISDTPTTAN